MVALEWKEEGDLRPGQDPAWEEGLQTREKVNVEKIREKKKTHMSASCRSGSSCAGIVDCCARKGAARKVLEEAIGGPGW